MESVELEWHKNQAQQIRHAAHAISKAEQSTAFYWWQVGERLNNVYGFTPPGKGGYSGKNRPTAEGHIPFLDMEEITGIYQAGKTTICRARVFHKKTRNHTEALRVIEDYGTWDLIYRGFLPGVGRSPDETRRIRREQYDQRQPQYIRAHVANVDDDIRDALIDNGLSRDETREAVQLFIRQSGWRQILQVWEIREQLHEWHRMTAS
jgi:hypothetical protein